MRSYPQSCPPATYAGGMSPTLEERLRRLEDILAIQQLFIDYGLALDAGDLDTYAQLFATQGTVNLGPIGRATGRTEI